MQRSAPPLGADQGSSSPGCPFLFACLTYLLL